MAEQTIKRMVPPVAYTTTGLEPVSAEFTLYMEEIREEILQILSKEINGIVDITWNKVDTDRPRQRAYYGNACDDYDMNGKPLENKYESIVNWYVWFDGNGEHFSTGKADNALGTPIQKNSEALKRFVNKFGYYFCDDFPDMPFKQRQLRELLTDNTNAKAGRHLKGIQVALTPILAIIMDRGNRGFTNEFNTSNPGDMIICKRYHFDKNSGKPILLQIKKSLRRLDNRGDRPTPKSAKRF